jgi:ribonuclease PH
MRPAWVYTSRAANPADKESPLNRSQNRDPDQFRTIKFTRAFTENTPGSVLIETGNTKVLCTVSITDHVPQWMHGRGGGWLTAEYAMLPGATHGRKFRDGRNNRVDARSLEIQRLIGRSLRSAVNLKSLPEITLWVDCDVLSADGGTRTASINGACVALYDALLYLEERKDIRNWPMPDLVSAMSVGIYNGQTLVDLDYKEDSNASVDLNIVCNSGGDYVEVQGSAEGNPFTPEQLAEMLECGRTACAKVEKEQRAALGL